MDSEGLDSPHVRLCDRFCRVAFRGALWDLAAERLSSEIMMKGVVGSVQRSRQALPNGAFFQSGTSDLQEGMHAAGVAYVHRVSSNASGFCRNIGDFQGFMREIVIL